MTPDQIQQIRGLLEKIISRLCCDCNSDGCATQEGCPYKGLFHEINQTLAILPCKTCNGTQQVGEEIIYQGRSMGWKECPDCDGE